jgi:cysteine synthase A
VAALAIARRSAPGTNIVCMLPDTGERYLSTPLFDEIGEAMSAEELAISVSTPGYRFDTPGGTPVSPTPAVVEVDPVAAQYVDAAIRGHAVVLFALEWCEFCWSVRKLFAQLGIEYHKVDLDSVELQRDDLGNKIRAVLAQRTGARTIPQIFIGNEHVGGCTDLFDGWRSGADQKRLDACNAAYDRGVTIDPYTLLPKWLQPRKAV